MAKNTKNNDWKGRLNVVYSTNPDFHYETEETEEVSTLPAGQQKLRVQLDRKNRGGKVVTLVTGFVGTDNDQKQMRRRRKRQGWRNHCARRFQGESARFVEAGRIYANETCGMSRENGCTDTPYSRFIQSIMKKRTYSARNVKRLKSVICNSGSASFSTSRTVFLPSMMSSWFSRQTSFKNLPRRPLAMF